VGKGLMFALFVWFIVSIAGGVMQGSTVTVASTRLSANLTAAGTTINVDSTTGFPESGIIQIGDERIAYSGTTATTFVGLPIINPIVRGADGTTAAAHAEDAVVRTLEASMLNNSINYKLAVLSDASGLMAFVTVPWTLISLLAEFFTLPLAFLGTDLQILTILWAVISIGIIASVAITMAGGRRV
jgi:hypothetical protein